MQAVVLPRVKFGNSHIKKSEHLKKKAFYCDEKWQSGILHGKKKQENVFIKEKTYTFEIFFFPLSMFFKKKKKKVFGSQKMLAYAATVLL